MKTITLRSIRNLLLLCMNWQNVQASGNYLKNILGPNVIILCHMNPILAKVWLRARILAKVRSNLLNVQHITLRNLLWLH